MLVVNRSEKAEDKVFAESERVLELLLPELPLKKAVALAAQIAGGRKNALYQRALEIAGDDNRR